MPYPSKSINTESLLENLTDVQRQAVVHQTGPLLVLAGPGSGKTRVITYRIAHLIATGTDPGNILALTFTNKAAQEMRSRVFNLVGPGRTTICTFHSLCARLLREFAGELALVPNFSIFDRADTFTTLREATTQSDLDLKNWPAAMTSEIIGRAKSSLLGPADYQAHADDFFTKQIAKIYTRYQKILRDNQALDFDDLLMRMVDALRNNDSVRAQLAQRYKQVLVDEYQDTNRAQYVIARVLCRDHQNICATGDPDQSIYGWRGADIANILDFEQDFPKAKIIRLEQNYRSTKTILSAADALIKANTLRREKKLWTENPTGEPVDVVFCQDDRAEADYLARQIATHVADGGNYSDIAVFYRVNSLSRLFEHALRSAGIPYQMVRGVAFYSRKEIKDVLAYLRILVNPSDSVSLLRIINTPARRIGNRTIKTLQEYSLAQQITLLEAVEQAERISSVSRALAPLRQFFSLLQELFDAPKTPVKTVMENLVRRTGLEAFYADDRHSDGTAIDNINELISSAAQYDQENPDGDLEDYLQQTALVSDVDALDAERGSVAMMTMHAAKGLEFPVVFMVGLEEGLLPHSRSAQSPAEMEEERRLCFVGITRAQRRLTLTYARYRQFRGTTSRTVPSPFLAELPLDSLRLKEVGFSLDQRFPTNGESGNSEKSKYSNSKLFSKVDKKASAKNSAVRGAKRRTGRADFISGLAQGSSVYHPRMGLGKIIDISRAGKFTRAVINFEDAGSKTLMLEYADLRAPTNGESPS